MVLSHMMLFCVTIHSRVSCPSQGPGQALSLEIFSPATSYINSKRTPQETDHHALTYRYTHLITVGKLVNNWDWSRAVELMVGWPKNMLLTYPLQPCIQRLGAPQQIDLNCIYGLRKRARVVAMSDLATLALRRSLLKCFRHDNSKCHRAMPVWETQ